MAKQKPNPSAAWDGLADSIVSSDEDRIQYWRNRAKVQSAQQIGAALTHAVEINGIQRKQVAARMETQPSAVTRLFSGEESNPTLDTMVGAALATGVKMIVTFELADDSNASPFVVVEKFNTDKTRPAMKKSPGAKRARRSQASDLLDKAFEVEPETSTTV